eukprot:16445547-Heterocapsa_arctica.AAC.1
MLAPGKLEPYCAVGTTTPSAIPVPAKAVISQVKGRHRPFPLPVTGLLGPFPRDAGRILPAR